VTSRRRKTGGTMSSRTRTGPAAPSRQAGIRGGARARCGAPRQSGCSPGAWTPEMAAVRSVCSGGRLGVVVGALVLVEWKASRSRSNIYPSPGRPSPTKQCVRPKSKPWRRDSDATHGGGLLGGPGRGPKVLRSTYYYPGTSTCNRILVSWRAVAIDSSYIRAYVLAQLVRRTFVGDTGGTRLCAGAATSGPRLPSSLVLSPVEEPEATL
jgi:hypothetical protein